MKTVRQSQSRKPTTGGLDILTICHLCLRTSGHLASSMLTGPGSQWVVASGIIIITINYYYYYYYYYVIDM